MSLCSRFFCARRTDAECQCICLEYFCLVVLCTCYDKQCKFSTMSNTCSTYDEKHLVWWKIFCNCTQYNCSDYHYVSMMCNTSSLTKNTFAMMSIWCTIFDLPVWCAVHVQCSVMHPQSALLWNMSRFCKKPINVWPTQNLRAWK